MNHALFRALNWINTRHPWSHNDAYHPWIMHHARRVQIHGGQTALDVGCGTGNLVRKMARSFDRVTGVDADDRAVQQAKALTQNFSNITLQHAAFPIVTTERFDLVTLVAVLHHLPLQEAICAAQKLVSPRGRLVIVGVYKEDVADKWLVALSLVLNPVIGLLKHPRPAKQQPVHMTAPTTEATHTFREISAHMCDLLPGVTLRRGLFWRYTAVWIAPTQIMAGGEKR